MISEREASRAETWVQRGGAPAARALIDGGRRRGALLHPTDSHRASTPAMRVCARRSSRRSSRSIPFDSLDEAIDAGQRDAVRAGRRACSRRTSRAAMLAARRLHVGVRAHQRRRRAAGSTSIPFAGVKQSGIGREGPKYAMQEMTEERLVTHQPFVGESTDMTGAMFIAAVPETGGRHQGVRPVRPHQLRADRRVPQAGHRVRLVPARAAWRRTRPTRTTACRTSSRCSTCTCRPGMTNALDRRRHGRRRLDADGRLRRQHAVVSPRARAAPGHPLPRRRVAGRHLPADLQARLARRRREVPGRRHAAGAERRADRTARAPCCIDVPMDVFSQQIDVQVRSPWRAGRTTARLRGARRRHRRRGAICWRRATRRR